MDQETSVAESDALFLYDAMLLLLSWENLLWA